ncbi:hypothetical protein JCM10296v2_006492 [Rhodotorula toruloides]
MPPSPSTLSRGQRLALIVVGCVLLVVLWVGSSATKDPASRHLDKYLPSLSLTSLSSPSLSRKDPLAYRRFLEETTSPANLTTHSPTLAFDHIYVLSLPARQDRRADMRQIADALGVTIEFVDAADKREPFLKWIAERVKESRDERRKVMAAARNRSPSSIGGLKIGSDWITPFPGDLSTFPLSSAKPLPDRFPRFPLTSPSYTGGAKTWVSHLESLHSAGGRHTSLRPSDPNLNVSSLLWDPREKLGVRQVHEGVISTYWGQTRAMKRMLENGDRTALILEDDVDIEWDLERLWKGIERRLPRNKETGEEEWDVTYLGHCWGGEFQKPQYLHPLLHRSTGPMCLHAYALTATGAHTLLSHLLDPWSAFSTAVDLVIPSLLHIQDLLDPRWASRDHGEGIRHAPLVRSWSVVPPLVVQRKDGPSDLQKGTGSPWRGVLRDSTIERIKRGDGTWGDEWDNVFDPASVDPATQLRCGPV